MKMLKKLMTFLMFDKNTKLILIEAFVFLGWARLLKSFKFSKISPGLGEYMEETSFSMNDSCIKPLKSVAQAVKLISRYTFWESMCLVKAIAAMKMLERRRIESTLYLGTAKDDNGKLIAHAWLRSGPYFVTGAEEMSRFIVVSKFAKKITNKRG